MPNPPPDPQSIVLSFLESLGRGSEAQFYLRLFREKSCFAVLAPSRSVVSYATGQSGDPFTEQLKVLTQLDLAAPVALFQPDMEGLAKDLCARLEDRGLLPVHLTLDASEPFASRASNAAHLLKSGKIPVLTLEPNASRISRIQALGAVCAALGSRKVVVVRQRGGLGRRDLSPPKFRAALGSLWLAGPDGGISVINLASDFDRLVTSNVLAPGDAALLTDAQALLATFEPKNLVVSVTSPLNLLRELFTIKGAGTLIRRGSTITRVSTYAPLDTRRLTDLLEVSFGKTLRPGFFERTPEAIYLEEDYRACAILEPGIGAAFLTKFVVDKVAQGEGLARDLWQAMIQKEISFYWRAHRDNPISAWYARLCDGMLRLPDWVVYWRGIDPQKVDVIVADALKRPVDFEPST